MITYGFIFARGGSKGLPRKNIKHLLGKPLICYSIEIAQQVSILNGVFVSTDDDEIADIARGSGAIVIDRPEELACDKCPEWLAWRHAIEWVESRYGGFDDFVSLPTTSPLRNVFDVESAINKRQSAQADICISITPANRSPFFNMVKKNTNGFVELAAFTADDVTRRQDAPEVYDITTVVYAASKEFIMNGNKIFDGKVTYIEVPKERAVDIDDIYDFKLAEIILRERS